MKKKMTAGLLAVIAILIFFLLIACGIIVYLFFQPADIGTTTNEGSANYSHNITAPENNLTPAEDGASAQDMAFWNNITRENVEAACLIRARQEAGSSADLVYFCACSASESADEKAYECDINTADPFTRYFANIDCALETRTCSIETNYGQTDISFEELKALYQSYQPS